MSSRQRSRLVVTHRRLAQRGWLRGPSAGLEAWTVYLMGVVDWMIDCRKRWHEVAPLASPRRWPALAGCMAGLFAVALLIVRVVGG